MIEPSPPRSQPLVVGVAGGTGSGKTTVARRIQRALGEAQCALIDHDAYYRDRPELTFKERETINFDEPSALESGLLAAHIDALVAGTPIEKPVYDFARHERAAETRTVHPARVIVVEGILVLAEAELRARMDVKIFVDTDADVRLFRRIRRDMEHRGRAFEDIRRQYFHTVRDAHTRHVAPTRAFADLIIPEGGENRVAIDVLIRALASMSGATLLPAKTAASA